jgi:hypothetical protein
MDSKTLLDQIIHNTILNLWSIIKTSWPSLWPYVLGFALFIVGGIILQILLLRSGRRNKLSPAFNSLVGSVIWTIIFLLLLGAGYLIWGSQVIDEIWFAIFSTLAFGLTWLFLVAIGFWYY